MKTFNPDTYFKAKFAYLGLTYKNDDVVVAEPNDEFQGYMFPNVLDANGFPQAIRDFYFAFRNYVSSCVLYIPEKNNSEMTAFERLKQLALATTSKEKISVDTYFEMFTLTKDDHNPAHLDEALKILVKKIKELPEEKRNHMLSLSKQAFVEVIESTLAVADDHVYKVNGVNNYVDEINKLDEQAQDYLPFIAINNAKELQAIDERQKEIATTHNHIMETTHNKSIYHSVQQLFAMTYDANKYKGVKTTPQIFKLKEYSEKHEKINPPYIEKLEFKDFSAKTMKK